MKNNLDFSKNPLHKEINFLVKKVIDQEYSREMIKNEIDRRFFPLSREDRDVLMDNIIRKCYRNAWLAESGRSRLPSPGALYGRFSRESLALTRPMEGCLAVSLTRFLIRQINGNTYRLTEDLRLENAFYDSCVRLLLESDLFAATEDPELMIIHLKQAMVILRASGLLSGAGGIARVLDEGLSPHSLLLVIFSSFWNRVKWEEIFPSNPDAARELRRNRQIMIDLMMNSQDPADLADLCNDFFEMTGLAGRDDLFLISFMDFYFFTWLQHFGIIRFLQGSDREPVSIELTDPGRAFLRCLQGIDE